MEHDQALVEGAVDRYVLGEMTTREMQLFEEHYFGCAVCSQDLRLATIMTENVRAVFAELPIAKARVSVLPERRAWKAWFSPQAWTIPGTIAVALAILIFYQNSALIPALQAPHNLSNPLILDGATRSSGSALHESQPIFLAMSLRESSGGDQISLELMNSSGKIVRGGLVSAPLPRNPLVVFFPGRLPVGQFTLIATAAGSGGELARDQFDVIP